MRVECGPFTYDLMAVPNTGLTIPGDFVEAAKAFAELDDHAFANLSQSLTHGGPQVSRPQLSQDAARATGWDEKLADSLVWMILSLIGMRQSLGYASLEHLADAVSRSNQFEESVDRARFATRLARAMSSPACQLLSHGHDLISEHEHLLAEARILSDIRPLFTDEVEIEGAVIGHVLRLNLFGGEPRTIDIALDVLDLKHLKDVVERAHEKDAQLRQMVKDSNKTLVLPIDVEPA